MADKFSSPSSASSDALHQQPQRTANEAYLTIVKEPPLYLFVDEVFEVDYTIERQSASSSDGFQPIQAQLEPVELSNLDPALAAATASTSNPPNDIPEVNLHILETRQPSVDVGVATLRCKIILSSGSSSSSRLQHTSAYQIRFSLAAAADLNTTLSAVSRPISLVQAKLRLETTPEWSNVWFKDEGGRDKSMEIIVEAIDSSLQPLHERLPLTLTLCYHADQPLRVMNQDVLRVIGSEKRLQIDKSTGRAKVRYRIEDVSKNHQGQDFVLQVAVDHRVYPGIAPAYTLPVSVRSKRNKRQRSSVDSTTGSQAHYDTRGSPPSAMGGSVEHQQQHTPLALDGADAEAILDAMHGIMKWAEDVYNGLHPLQWQVLGYARNEDGSPDYSRPYHSMYNPNNVISRIRAAYMDSTRKQLHVLEQALCRTSSSSLGEPFARAANHPGMPPQQQQDPYWMSHGGIPPLQPMMHPLAIQQQHRQAHEINYEYPQPRGYYGMRPNHLPPPVQNARFDEPLALQQQHAPLWQNHQLQQQQLQQSPPRLSLDDSQAAAAALDTPEKASADDTDASELGEEQVEYVLAKQYKSLHTRNKLGFPAYSLDKKLLGFFASSSKAEGGGGFIPITELEDFASPEVQQQASHILQEAIDTKSNILYSLRDWGSLGNLLDRVFVYDWSKGLSGAAGEQQHLDVL